MSILKCVSPLLYLFGLVLLMIARWHQTVSIDTFITGSCVAMGTGIALLHSQKGANALNFALETAVSQSLALWAQATCSHPLSVLLLLGGATGKAGTRVGVRKNNKKRTGETRRKLCMCVSSHVLAAQENLVHAFRCWNQQSDKELLCGHIDIWSNLTSCKIGSISKSEINGYRLGRKNMHEYGWCDWAKFTDSLALLQSSLLMLPVLKRRTVILDYNWSL